MNIRPIFRGMTVALLSTAALVGIAGCTASKMMTKAQPTDPSDATPKKEYQWKDMSQGKVFFGPPKETPPAQ